MVYDILAVAFAVFFLTNFVKYFVRANMLPTLKMLIVAVLSLGGILALRFDQGWLDIVTAWLVASAVATFVHGIHKLIHAVGDERRVSTLRSRSRAR